MSGAALQFYVRRATGERIDPFDEGRVDRLCASVGDREVEMCLVPPFVTRDQYERYRARTSAISGLHLRIAWHILGYPGGEPRQWVQEFRDGIEQPLPRDGSYDLRLELTFSSFLYWITGLRPAEELDYPPTVRGSVAGMSALHYLVQQADWLRGRTVGAVAYQLVKRGVFERVGIGPGA
jgi:hypothetical protein